MTTATYKALLFPRGVLLVVALAAVAFSVVAFMTTWWQQTGKVTSSSISTFTTGQVSSVKWGISSFSYSSNMISTVSGTVDYNNLDNSSSVKSTMDLIADFLAVEIAVSCLFAFMFILSLFDFTRKFMHFQALPWILSVLALIAFGLGLANLLLIINVPQAADTSVAQDVSSTDVASLPLISCGTGSGNMTLSSVTFSGESISCSTVWSTLSYDLVATDGSTSTAVTIDVTIATGEAWWWQVGSFLAFAFLFPVYVNGRKELFVDELPYLEVDEDNHMDKTSNEIEIVTENKPEPQGSDRESEIIPSE